MKSCGEYLPEISLSAIAAGSIFVLYDQIFGIENTIRLDQCPDRSYKPTMIALSALGVSALVYYRLHYDRARRKWVSQHFQMQTEHGRHLETRLNILSSMLSFIIESNQSAQLGRRLSTNAANPSSASTDSLASM